MVLPKFIVRRLPALGMGRKVVKLFKRSSASSGYTTAQNAKQLKQKSEVFFPMRNSLQMDGKVALVMGGTNEVGILCVREMLNAGVQAVMIADDNEQVGRAIVREMSAAYEPERVAFIRTDTTEMLLRNVFVKTIDHFEKIDVVVNIARQLNNGLHEEIDRNVKATALCTLLGFEYMGASRGNKEGSILNMICDMGTSQPSAVYEGCRHYLLSFGKAVSQQYSKDTCVKVVTLFVDIDVVYKKKSSISDRPQCDFANVVRVARAGSLWVT